MSLFLVLYLFSLCGLTAAFVYGIVRPERPRRTETTVHPLRPAPIALKRARRLAA